MESANFDEVVRITKESAADLEDRVQAHKARREDAWKTLRDEFGKAANNVDSHPSYKSEMERLVKAYEILKERERESKEIAEL